MSTKKRKRLLWSPKPAKKRKFNNKWPKNVKINRSSSSATNNSNYDNSDKTDEFDIDALVNHAIQMDDFDENDFDDTQDKNNYTDSYQQQHVQQQNKIQKKLDDVDVSDDNTEFEIVKQDQKAIENNPYLESNPSYLEPIDIKNGSEVLKIKFATPAKGKHTEYNLKSLQESIESEQTRTILIMMMMKIKINIHEEHISKSSEWYKLGNINEHLVKHLIDFMKLPHPTVIQKLSRS